MDQKRYCAGPAAGWAGHHAHPIWRDIGHVILQGGGTGLIATSCERSSCFFYHVRYYCRQVRILSRLVIKLIPLSEFLDMSVKYLDWSLCSSHHVRYWQVNLQYYRGWSSFSFHQVRGARSCTIPATCWAGHLAHHTGKSSRQFLVISGLAIMVFPPGELLDMTC